MTPDMSAHPIDYGFQANVYSTPEMTALYDETSRIERWLGFEAALAASQAELGIIPQAAADEIARRATLAELDPNLIRAAYGASHNSLIPVLKALRCACQDGCGEYVHYGATTQDAVDTGEVLALKETLSIARRDLRQIEDSLIDLALTYRETPMIGRTHSQQALPITFGAKVAVWLAEVGRHSDRIDSLEDRVLRGQLSGAVGTMAALGEHAQEVKRRTMEKLGLRASPEAWHTARDDIAEACACLAMITSTMGKIANEIVVLGRTELGELREPLVGEVSAGSSTMPHKRNPVLCQRVVVLSAHVRALLSTVMEAMIHENERDPRSLWSEWLALPQMAIYTGAALHSMSLILANVEVYPERMLSNLHLHSQMVASEWLLFRLASHIGKASAQEAVQSFIQQATREGLTLIEVAHRDTKLGTLLNEEDLAVAATPETYIGHATGIVDAVVSSIGQRRSMK
jgi:adenylosuccinate lyase